MLRIRRALPDGASHLLQLVPVLLALEYRFRISDVSFTLAELVLPIALAVALLGAIASARMPLPKSFVLAALLTCGTAFVSVFFQSDIKHAASVYRDFTLPLVFYAVFISFRLRPGAAVRLAKAFVVWASAAAALGVVQFYTNEYLWFQPDDMAAWQEYKSRLVAASAFGQALGATNTLAIGLYSHANNFASYLVIPALVTYTLIRSPRVGILWRCVWMILGAVQLAGLTCTFSRSSVLTLMAGIVAIELFIMRRRAPGRSTLIAATAVIIALTVGALKSDVFSFDDLGTFGARTEMLESSMTLVLNRPAALLTGGLTQTYLGEFSQFYDGQLVHNVFMYILLQFGVVALLCWLALLLFETRRIAGALGRGDPDTNVAGASLIGVLVTAFFYGQTYSLLDSVQIGLWLFFWLGISWHQAISKAAREPRLVAPGARDSRDTAAEPGGLIGGQPAVTA